MSKVDPVNWACSDPAVHLLLHVGFAKLASSLISVITSGAGLETLQTLADGN